MPSDLTMMPTEQPSLDNIAEALERVRTDGGMWCYLKAWHNALLGVDAPDWFSLESDPRAFFVKRGRLRVVWRVRVDGREVFAKVIERERGVSRFKAWPFGSNVAREWRAAWAAIGRGISTVVPLAMGLQLGGGRRTVLITGAVADAVPLPAWWRREVSLGDAGDRRTRALPVMEAVARLLAMSHERGFAHRDGHPGNVLIHPSQNGGAEACYVDVLGARITKPPLSRRARVSSLAQLSQYARYVTTRAERLRWLRMYCSHRSTLTERSSENIAAPLAPRRLAADVDAERQRQAYTLAKQRDRRLRRDGAYFAMLELRGGWQVRVVLKLGRRHVFAEEGVPDREAADWMDRLRAVLLVDGDERSGSREVERGGIRCSFDEPGGWFEGLRWTCSGSPHRAAFEQCHRRRHRDIAGDLILGYGEHRSGGLIDQTALIRPA